MRGTAVETDAPRGPTVEAARRPTAGDRRTIDTRPRLTGKRPRGVGLLDQIGPDEVIAEIAAALEADHWPEPLIEHMASGLRVRSGLELLERWYDARGRVLGLGRHPLRPLGPDRRSHVGDPGHPGPPPVG